MMSQAQRGYLLWGGNSLWRQVCAKLGWEFPANEERHKIYAELYAEGQGDLTHLNFKDFSQKDFDVLKARFLALIDPADVQGQLDAMEQRRKRLEHACMEQAKAAASHGWVEYMQRVMNGKFEKNDLEELTEAQLVMLVQTLGNRAASKRRMVKDALKNTVENPF